VTDQGWLAALTAGLIVALATGACETLYPISHTAQVRGAISGTLNGPRGDLSRRTIVAVDAVTAKEYRTRTNNVGDYTLQLQPGHYHVVVRHRAHESPARGPGVIDLGPGDIKSDQDLYLVGPGDDGTLLK
jgi:hypothetical protein